MKSGAVNFLVVAVMLVVSTYAQECKNGEVVKKDCNTCTCVNGLLACTRKHCVQRRQTVCRPNETFKRDCNTCKCSPDGQNAACTFKLCV